MMESRISLVSRQHEKPTQSLKNELLPRPQGADQVTAVDSDFLRFIYYSFF